MRLDLALDARLFVLPREPSEPSWASFLRDAARGELPPLSNQLTGAVLLVRRRGRLWP